MIFDREVAVFIALLALCVMLVLTILHITEVIAAPTDQVRELATDRTNTYINWRIIDGRRCYYIGRRIDKSLLYWEPEKPIEVEEMPLPAEAPAIRAQEMHQNSRIRWQGCTTTEPTA